MDIVSFNLQQGTFAQANDGHFLVHDEELLNSLLPGLPGMSLCMGIKVMGVDLERNQSSALKAFRLYDGHVIGSH